MKTILVVDDDKELRTMMRFVLAQNSFNVVEADNGTTALSLATEVQPDLVISDVKMDNVNGFMLCEMLRKEPATSSIPIILMTGTAFVAGAWGADDSIGYLEKPVSMADLLKAINERV